ncbi:hypothetical protein CYMTET_50156, partial [Cymbomonas tetramitiformis]
VALVVSTNVDGLHCKSGLEESRLAELHGNCFLETCSKCGARYVRDFDVTTRRGAEAGVTDIHMTGRKCEAVGCDGALRDNIIHFKENLPQAEIEKAMEHAIQADLALVLGTSMRVSPACELPGMMKGKDGKLVICNLQKTPYDHKAHLRIHGDTSAVLEALVAAMQL